MCLPREVVVGGRVSGEVATGDEPAAEAAERGEMTLDCGRGAALLEVPEGLEQVLAREVCGGQASKIVSPRCSFVGFWPAE